MKIPNAERAIVDIEKLRDYCLNPEHPRGRHKARVFVATLGLTTQNAGELRDALLAAVQSEDAVLTDRDAYGQRYVLDFTMRGPTEQVVIRSSWIIRRNEDFPRLTSCYVS